MRSSAPFTPSTLMRFLLSGSPPHGRDEFEVLTRHVIHAGNDQEQTPELEGRVTRSDRASGLVNTHPEVLHRSVQPMPNRASAIHALHSRLLVGSVGVVLPHGGAGVWAGAWRAGDNVDGVPPVTTPPEPHGSSAPSSCGTIPPLRASAASSRADMPPGSSGAAAGLSAAPVPVLRTPQSSGLRSTTSRGTITTSPARALPHSPAPKPLTRSAFTCPRGTGQLQSRVTLMTYCLSSASQRPWLARAQ